MKAKYTTKINGNNVGSGHWKVDSAKKFCLKKSVNLESLIYVTYDINYGYDYENVNIENGQKTFLYNSDMISSMGINF